MTVNLTPEGARRLRYERWFDCLDRNNSGTLDEDDFRRIVNETMSLTGLAETDPKIAALQEAALTFWELLCICVDVDESGTVDREEWVVFQAITASQGEEFDQVPPWVTMLIKAMLSAFDDDGDGHISPAEYGQYLQIMGSDADPKEAFHRLDLDGSGVLELHEVEHLLMEFFLSEDPKAHGTHFVVGPILTARS